MQRGNTHQALEQLLEFLPVFNSTEAPLELIFTAHYIIGSLHEIHKNYVQAEESYVIALELINKFTPGDASSPLCISSFVDFALLQ